MKHRIAVICNYRLQPSRVGGMDYFFWNFDKKCKEDQVAVDWYFPNTSDHGNYPDLNIIPAEGQQIEHLFLTSLKTQSYHVVITHFLELCTPFYKRIAEVSDAKIICVDHNPRPQYGYSLKKRIEKRFKGLLFSRYIDAFVAVSKYTERELYRDFGSRIAGRMNVIYNGIDTGLYQKSSGRGAKGMRFIVASHLRQSKGIQDLIVAVSEIHAEKRTGIKIDIYGEGPFRSELESLVQTTDTGDIFEFKGSSSNLHAIYCRYDYMLQPTHMECFSMSILESLCANVPVLTTSVGGNEEVIFNGVNGYILPPSNPKALSELMLNMIEGTIRIEGDVSHSVVKQYSIDNMVNNHNELLNKILQTKSTPTS
jgi:glycosyltransferase involved in cell wall biosynthesis